MAYSAHVAPNKSFQRISGALGPNGRFVVLDVSRIDVSHGMNPKPLNSALAAFGAVEGQIGGFCGSSLHGLLLGSDSAVDNWTVLWSACAQIRSIMKHQNAEVIIGYSGFDIFEEGYFYFENECYVADTRNRVDKLMKNSFLQQGDYRITPIGIDDIMQDYGVSSGRFAMEPTAFTNFQSVAEANGIRFQASREEETDVPLMIVEIEGM